MEVIKNPFLYEMGFFSTISRIDYPKAALLNPVTVKLPSTDLI
jgi:hypothetical protein